MGWGSFKKEELPEELKDLTPAEIADAVRKSKTLEAEVAALKAQDTERSSAFETFRTEYESTKADLETLKAAQKPPERRDQNQEMTSFLVDGDRAFAERAAPLASMILNSTAVLAKNEVLRRMQAVQRTKTGNIDGYLFEKLEPEIMQLASQTSAQALANPATWEHLFYNVKGRHADEIAASQREGKGEFFVEPAAASGGGLQQKEDPKKLTPVELKIAAKLGQKPEDYAAQKEKISLGIPAGVLE